MREKSPKKLYLVNPSEKGILDNAGDRMPLGLLNVAANARKEHAVKVYDLNHTREDEFMRDFMVDRPDAVGVSVYTSPIYAEAIRLASLLKGKTRLIAGGYHATAMPDSLKPYFDAIVRGDGEQGILEAMCKNGVITGTRERLASIPDIRLDDLDSSRYGIDQNGKRAGTVITSRGCPNSCTFCGKTPGSVRYDSVRKVRKQIDELRREGFEAVYFLDDVFTMGRERMTEIAQDVRMPFRFTTRANMVDRAKLETLADAGAEMMSLGVESGDDEILGKANKGMKVVDNIRAVREAKECGIDTKGFFIIGLPGETEASARKTIELSQHLKSLGMTGADFYFLTPFPGTPIWNNPRAHGINIRDRDFKRYLQAGQGAKCVVDTEELPAERIEELVEEAKESWKN